MFLQGTWGQDNDANPVVHIPGREEEGGDFSLPAWQEEQDWTCIPGHWDASRYFSHVILFVCSTVRSLKILWFWVAGAAERFEVSLHIDHVAKSEEGCPYDSFFLSWSPQTKKPPKASPGNSSG